MASFELFYDEEEDTLEVTFETYSEDLARTVPLNDNIVLYVDAFASLAWGVAFYSYSQLLLVSETHLDGLRPLPEADARRLLRLLEHPPVTHFLRLLDSGGLRALVLAPNLQDLLSS